MSKKHIPTVDRYKDQCFDISKGIEFPDEIIVSVAKNCGHDKRGRITNSVNEALPNDFELIAQTYMNDPDEKVWKKCS